MEIERQFVEGQASPDQAPMIGDRQIVNSMLASNAVDKRVMDDRAIGPRELDLDYSTIADGEVLSFSLENGVLVLQAVPAANIGGVIPANASVDASKINTGSDTPMDLEFLQYTTSGLRWSAIPRQTNITADEIASGVIPTIPASLPASDNSVDNDSFADDLVIALKHIPGNIPQSRLSLSLEVSDLPTIPYTKLSGTPTIPTIPSSLVSPANSILPAQINAGGTAEAGKILKLTSATAWGWADDNSGGGSGGIPDNESVTEAKLDAHNNPVDGYALKYSTTNGLFWGADNNTTYSFSDFVSGTPTTGQVVKQTTNGPAWADEIGLTIGGTQSTGRYIRATSATAQEWADFPTIAYSDLTGTPTTLPASDDSVDNDSFVDSLVIASKHIPTISYTSLSDRPTIPTVPSTLPPSDDSVGEAAINATDTPSDGEFLQVSIDNNGNRTLNWSAALTGAAGSITETMLAIHNSPTDDYVLAWDNDNSRLYWKVDKDTTYTLPTISTLVNGTPTSNQVVAWDSTNSRAYWKDDADTTPSLSDLVTGTPSNGQYPSYNTTNSRWELASLPATPTLASLVNGTPTDGQVPAWDATNSRAEWTDAASGGLSISGTQAANKLIRATSATAQQWANIQDFINGTPTANQVPVWDATNSRLNWANQSGGGGGGGGDAKFTAIASGSGTFSASETTFTGTLNSGESFDDYDALCIRYINNAGSWSGVYPSHLFPITTSSIGFINIHKSGTSLRTSTGYFRKTSSNAFSIIDQRPQNNFSANYQYILYGVKFGGGGGLTIGGTQAADKVVAATSASAQEWKNLQDLIHGTPTDDQVAAWDATNSRVYWKDDQQGSGGGGSSPPLSLQIGASLSGGLDAALSSKYTYRTASNTFTMSSLPSTTSYHVFSGGGIYYRLRLENRSGFTAYNAGVPTLCGPNCSGLPTLTGATLLGGIAVGAVSKTQGRRAFFFPIATGILADNEKLLVYSSGSWSPISVTDASLPAADNWDDLLRAMLRDTSGHVAISQGGSGLPFSDPFCLAKRSVLDPMEDGYSAPQNNAKIVSIRPVKSSSTQIRVEMSAVPVQMPTYMHKAGPYEQTLYASNSGVTSGTYNFSSELTSFDFVYFLWGAQAGSTQRRVAPLFPTSNWIYGSNAYPELHVGASGFSVTLSRTSNSGQFSVTSSGGARLFQLRGVTFILGDQTA